MVRKWPIGGLLLVFRMEEVTVHKLKARKQGAETQDSLPPPLFPPVSSRKLLDADPGRPRGWATHTGGWETVRSWCWGTNKEGRKLQGGVRWWGGDCRPSQPNPEATLHPLILPFRRCWPTFLSALRETPWERRGGSLLAPERCTLPTLRRSRNPQRAHTAYFLRESQRPGDRPQHTRQKSWIPWGKPYFPQFSTENPLPGKTLHSLRTASNSEVPVLSMFPQTPHSKETRAPQLPEF